MKLLIKANNRGLKVKAGGDTRKILGSLMTAVQQIMVGVSENEQGFEEVRTLIINAVQAMEYDGTVKN